MKKVLVVMCCVAIVAAMAGCGGIRTYVTTKDRVDIEVAGNQGVIFGPAPAPHKVADPTRDIITTDVELPTTAEVNTAIRKEEPAATTTADTGATGVTEKIK
jgi:hypothetical protein